METFRKILSLPARLISFPDLLWTKPKARSGQVGKFLFLDWLLNLTPVQSLLWIFTRFSATNLNGSMLQIWRSQGNLQHLTKTCAVFAATQQIPTRGSRFFRITKKPAKLQRLISDFAKVRVQEDDCFPKHVCRNCYRTLLNLRDKLLPFQTRYATTQINLGKGGEKVKRTRSSPKSSPFTSPCRAQRQKESRINTQN